MHGSAHSIMLHAAEVAPGCFHLPPSSPPLTTWGYVSLTILYLLTTEPLGEFSEGFVVRHFLALKVHFQLTLKACRNKKKKKNLPKSCCRALQFASSQTVNYIWPLHYDVALCLK